MITLIKDSQFGKSHVGQRYHEMYISLKEIVTMRQERGDQALLDYLQHLQYTLRPHE